MISDKAEKVLVEIVKNEKNSEYWKKRFEGLTQREDTILRGCFKELRESDLISVQWGDNIPYSIFVQKDGYSLYDSLISKKVVRFESDFEEELFCLLERTKTIKKPINVASISTDIDEYNRPSQEWLNDVEIFYNKYLKQHSLADRMNRILFHRQLSAYNDMVSCLSSISKDEDFIALMRKNKPRTMGKEVNNMAQYDLFISHANSDKLAFVNELYDSLNELGITIFYDKATLDWGDNWKNKILEGVEKAEFAIIVISENFFGREWTEKELNEFLKRQNANGQKLILPVLYNISIDQLREKYPNVADIQAINSADYSCEKIAISFARQLIKRLKGNQ